MGESRHDLIDRTDISSADLRVRPEIEAFILPTLKTMTSTAMKPSTIKAVTALRLVGGACMAGGEAETKPRTPADVGLISLRNGERGRKRRTIRSAFAQFYSGSLLAAPGIE